MFCSSGAGVDWRVRTTSVYASRRAINPFSINTFGPSAPVWQRLFMTLAAIELGGSKILVTADGIAGNTRAPIRIPTATPEVSVPAAIAALRSLQPQGAPFTAIGVASFGPLQLDESAPDYGRILNTPKRAWAGFDLVGAFRDAFNLPIVLENDVNAAALGERHHAAKGCTDYAYITVGTGVGVGVVTGGRPIHGAGHPEAGHLLIRRRPDDTLPGICFAHGDCLEGLISGPALDARTGGIERMAADHPCWDQAGDYLAQLCMALVLIVAPQRIVLGGGVGARPELLAAARRHLWSHLNGYLDRYREQRAVDALLAPAVLEHSALTGALQLAAAAAEKRISGTPRVPRQT